jgi:hypothetical protein
MRPDGLHPPGYLFASPSAASSRTVYLHNASFPVGKTIDLVLEFCYQYGEVIL